MTFQSRLARALIRRWAGRLSGPAAGWPALHSELDRWRDKTAKFWWRDDDAISMTPALRYLLAVRDAQDIPLAIAVIPVGAVASLGSALSDWPGVSVFAHGGSHRDHSAQGQPPGELTAGRNVAEVVQELSHGRARLEDMFGQRFRPVLVPPYNHLAPRLASAVRQAGFSFVSVDGDFVGLPLPSRNVHIDVINWSRNEAATPADLVRSAIVALRLRRFGLVGIDSPIGLVTHHLVHDGRMSGVMTSFLKCLGEHPAASFPEIQEIFC
jgi:peptidoglycan/xylan/chitin deacetylase (PgdA/CDA1 family)